MPQHAELHLLLSMIVPVPWLERVPTYKEQQQNLDEKDLSTYGFLGYPLLQTADIIIYKADAVPVGEDQAPHIELAREIVRRFNNLYGEVFPEPQTLLTEAKRIPGTDGRKMSKSYGNAIYLKDDPETLQAEAAGRCSPTRRASAAPTRATPRSARCSTCTRPSRPRRRREWAARGLPHAPGIGCLDCKAKLAEHMLERLARRPRAAAGARRAPRHRLGHPARGVEAGARGGRGHDGRGPRGDEDPLREAVSDESPKPEADDGARGRAAPTPRRSRVARSRRASSPSCPRTRRGSRCRSSRARSTCCST